MMSLALNWALAQCAVMYMVVRPCGCQVGLCTGAGQARRARAGGRGPSTNEGKQ